jgi:hypothetical protein
MPADAVVKIDIRPVISDELIDAIMDLGQKVAAAGDAFLRLAALLAPPEGETVDSMSVHYESASRPCPSAAVHQSHTWTPAEGGLQVPCPGVRPGM